MSNVTLKERANTAAPLDHSLKNMRPGLTCGQRQPIRARLRTCAAHRTPGGATAPRASRAQGEQRSNPLSESEAEREGQEAEI